MKVFSVIVVLFLNLDYWKYTFIACNIITKELCGSDAMVNLEPAGEASSITILLNPKDHKKICRLNITAPNSHVVSLQWHDENPEQLENSTINTSPCPLSVFLPEDKNTAVWKGNPCLKDSLPEVDLLTPNLRLSWNPPRFGVYTRGRKLIITAVGQDEVCIQRGQHVCMRIGWKPMLCVSDELVCDGNLNCPRGSSRSDEDEIMCNSHLQAHNSWKNLAEVVIKKLPADIVKKNWLSKRNENHTIDLLHQQTNLMSQKDIETHDGATGSHPYHHDTGDSVSAVITHYGTWGYLMLAMLIVGTVLMFCGLWECCFRKPKPPLELQSQPPSTTVLIINRSQDNTGIRPPNYDELDQPPSYVTLFPNSKIETDVITDGRINTCNNPVNQTFSNNCDSSDEHSDYVSNDDDSNRLCNSSSSNQQQRVDDRHNAPVVCIVTSL